MATQIGVDTVIPWQADRSIAKWKAGRTDRKWRQVLEAATEQSRRCWTPELGDCVSSKGIVAICRRACVHGELVIVLHQDATHSWHDIEESIAALSDRCLNDGRTRAITVVVGPEGGISEAEVRRVRRRRSGMLRIGNEHPARVRGRARGPSAAVPRGGTLRLAGNIRAAQ